MRFYYSAGTLIYKYSNNTRVFLLLKKKSGMLDIPKGLIRKSESALKAAMRETKEETGLNVRPERFFKQKMTLWYYKHKERAKKDVTIFIARVGGNAKVKISWEHEGREWLSVRQAEASKFMFKQDLNALREANAYIDRLEALEAINKEYAKLPRMERGWKLSKRFVHGEGPANAKLMLIGQAPGADEDRLRRPFVGRSGRLLDKMLHIARLKREDVYITSVVQFFPPDNRLPDRREIRACRPFIDKQIRVIGPKLIILVGSLSAGELAGIESIMSDHGKLIVDGDRKYFVTLHPAAAVRLKKNVALIRHDFENLRQVLKNI